MRAVTSSLLLGVIATIAFGVSSCSVLVDPENSDVKCLARSGSADPCGEIEAGLVCRAGRCERCEPGTVREDCNGIDDDCDGKIDEGHDQDRDGFTWCGGGDRALADCVDTDPTIRPRGDTLDGVIGHRDTCGDGIDNDCSGVPDDDPTCDGTANCEDTDTPCLAPGTCMSCPGGQQCEPCPAGTNCGSRRSICVTPLNPGLNCTSDTDCNGGLCVDNAALGVMSSVGKACTRACCSDLDCDAEDLCLVRGNGTRLCTPPGLVGRVTTKQGQPCSSNDECASGSCDPPSEGGETVCRRPCTSDADCADALHGSACVFVARASLSNPGSFACGEPMTDGAGAGEYCVPSPNRCASHLCLTSPIYIGQCTASCRSDCGDDSLTCTYTATNPLLAEITRAPICVRTGGTAALGASCQDSDDCAEGGCANGTCARVCCNDSDCGEQRCRPIRSGSSYGMYCAP